MKNLTVPIAIFVLAVLAGVAVIILPGKPQAPTEGSTTGGIADLILVDTPTKGSKISSPVAIAGSARGTWYFEASFPIEIRDASGATIAQGHAEAQSDWMTENFVIFKASIAYPAQPAGSHGTVVLKKDNPSGDPARDQSVEIPVIFN